MLSIFLIGLFLSIDAFSVALSIGSENMIKNTYTLPIIVGIFHLIMPIFGNILGITFFNIFNFNPKIILIIILFYLLLLMIFSEDNTKEYKLSILSYLLISFSVSIDSFSIGFIINAITNNSFAAFVIFSICSCTITYCGLIIGKYYNKKFKKKSKLAGIFILIIVIFVNICQIIIN